MIRACLFLAGVLTVAAPAAAQVNTLETDNPREDARMRLGPLYVTPGLQLREFGIDSNVFNDTSGNERSDWTVTIAPTANVWLPFARRALFKADLATDLVWYRKFDSERSVDPNIALRGEVYFRRFTLFAQNDLLYTRQRPSYELDLRTRRSENTAAAGVDVRLTPKFTIELLGRRSDTSYGSDAFFLGTDLGETLDRRTVGAAATARFFATALTTIELRGERFDDRFPGAPARDSGSVRVMPGVAFKPRALINGHAYVGARALRPVNRDVLPEFTGLVSDLALTYTLLGSTTFGVSHLRDVGYSFEAQQPYFLSTSIGGRVRQALGPKFDAMANADRTRYAYRDFLDAVPDPGGRSRVDTTWNYSVSLGYRIGRQGRIGAGVTWWQRESTARTDRDYKTVRFGAVASYGI